MNNFIKGIVLVMMLGILSTLVIFSTLFVANMNNEVTGEINTQIQNNAVGIVDTDTLTAISNINADAQAVTYPIDLLMIVVFITMVALITLLAYFTEPLSSFNTMTFLIFGIMIILLAVNFLKQIQDFLREQLVTNVFTAAETTLPFYNWYMSNYAFIVIGLIVWAIVVNQTSSIPSNRLGQYEDSIREE